MNLHTHEKQVSQPSKEKAFCSIFDPHEDSPLFRKPIWTPIPRSFNVKNLGPVIFSSKLQKKSKTLGYWMTRYYFLFEDYLAYGSSIQPSKIKKYMSLEGMKIWLPSLNNEQKEDARDISLAFFKCNKTIILKAQDAELLRKWLFYLRKKCIMANLSNYYETVKPLGTGSYGKVLLVKSKEDGKQYAAKVISKEHMVTKFIGVSVLKNEINTLRKLDHKNVVKLKEVFETSNSVHLILEYIEGSELYTVLQQRIFFKESECISLLKSLLETVAYLHSKSIVHRDLKPENLMIPSGKSSEVKLIDFGLSVDISEEKEGKRGGTPGYIAPEILNSQSARVIINEKNDIFSIGCIFYRLLTGTKLFKGNSAKEIFEKNKECKINLQKPSLCHVSNLAKDLLSKLLEKDVQKRPSAVEALKHPFFDQDQESSLKELPNSKEDTNIPSTTQYNFDVSLIKESNVRSASRLSKIIDSKGTIYFHPHIPFDSLRPSSNHLEGGQKLPALSLNNFDLTPNSGTCYGGESSIGSFLYPSRPRLDESKPGHFSTPNSPIQNSSILNLKYELKQRGLNSHSKSPFKNTLSKKVLSQNATPVRLDLSSSNTPKIMLNGGFSEYLSHYSRERESKTPNQQILKPRRKLISIGEDRDGDSSVSSMTDSCDVNDS